MKTTPSVKVCVGSSCHIKGARELIMKFDELLKQTENGDTVSLSGSFCMERCGEGLNWEIDGEPITSSSVDSALETFRERVLASISAGDNGRTENRE